MRKRRHRVIAAMDNGYGTELVERVEAVALAVRQRQLRAMNFGMSARATFRAAFSSASGIDRWAIACGGRCRPNRPTGP